MYKTATSKVPPVLIFSFLQSVLYLIEALVIVLDGTFFLSQENYLDFQNFEARINSILKQMFGPRPANPSSSVGMTVQTPEVSTGLRQSYTATPMVNTSTFNSSNNLADATRVMPTTRMNGGNVSNNPMYDSIVYTCKFVLIVLYLTGSMINGHQQLSAGFSVSSNDNGQMIPTPGFNNTDVYQSHQNGDGGNLMAVGRQHAVISYDGMHYNSDQQMGGGFRSNMHQNASGMINTPQSSGVGMSGNSFQLANGNMSSEGVISSTHFSNSSQPLQQPVDQLQQVSHVHSNYL